jgi:glutathione S-transferase
LASDRPSIADIACFPYVALAPDGGVSLDAYPTIRLWSRALRSLYGFIEMPGIHRLHELKPDPQPETGEA